MVASNGSRAHGCGVCCGAQIHPIMMQIENRMMLEAWCRFLFWLFVVAGAFGGVVFLIKLI
jgi:hypothetical protein